MRDRIEIELFQETVVSVENAHVLTDKKALHLRALKTFTDDFGKERLNGEEWLITHEDTETHILHVYEQLVALVGVITLNSRQYCIVLDPVEDGKPHLGKKVGVQSSESCLVHEFSSRNWWLVKNPSFFNLVKNLRMVFKMSIFWVKMKVLFSNVLKHSKINKRRPFEIPAIDG